MMNILHLEKQADPREQVLQKVDNPNEIVIILKYKSIEKAQALAQSEGLRNAVQRADVNSVSDVIFVNEI